MKMQAEAMQPQAEVMQEPKGPPEAGGGKKDPPRKPEGAQPCQHLDFRLCV